MTECSCGASRVGACHTQAPTLTVSVDVAVINEFINILVLIYITLYCQWIQRDRQIFAKERRLNLNDLICDCSENRNATFGNKTHRLICNIRTRIVGGQ